MDNYKQLEFTGFFEEGFKMHENQEDNKKTTGSTEGRGRVTSAPESRNHMGRAVNIQKVLNGYIVNVGCQTVVFNDRDTLLIELSKYFYNPAEREAHYRKIYGGF